MIDPDILVAIARVTNRQENDIGTPLPFHGVDIWNTWDLSWLGPGNLPEVATATFLVPADSDNLIESKSLKLYLNGFAMTRFADTTAVTATIARDLSACAGSKVDVLIERLHSADDRVEGGFSGTCLDSMDVACDAFEIDAGLLAADSTDIVAESLYTHLLRSLCPVTGQPDIASLQINYRGPRINPASLLQYIISFREHNDFHEACVERMFVDLLAQCGTERLSVYARYQRRGGIDINPFRSNFEPQPENRRLWRQ